MADGMSYIKVFLDWTDATRKLKDAEKGRLIDALVAYAKGEDGVEDRLTGSEAYVFPMFQLQIDRDKAEFDDRKTQNRENGKKGGRPKKPNGFCENPKNRTVFAETEKSQDKDKEYIDNNNARARAGETDCVRYFLNRVNPTAPPRDLESMAEIVQRFNERGGDGNEMVIRACDTALSNRAANWPYISKCLNSWLASGIYTPEELDAHERDRARKQGQKSGTPAAQSEKPKDKDPDAWLKNHRWGPRPPGCLDD